MSHLSSVFNSVPVKIQDRSGFDMSHENLFTAKVGTLIPASVEEVLPGDVVSIGSALNVELPPLATNFKGRVDAKLEAFFVPNRILWAGWQDFICQDPNHKPNVPNFQVPAEIPKVRLPQGATAAGTLADYLGVRGAGSSTIPTDVNALPFLAYQKIWDDWYRDSTIQNSFFFDGINSSVSSTASPFAAGCPYLRITGIMDKVTGNNTSSGSKIGSNGHLLTDLNQRNFAKDYFTTMSTEPQAGAAASLEFDVPFNVNTQADQGGNVDFDGTANASFTIRSLRAANSLQKWLDRNGIGGTRYYDQILAHFGVVPTDAALQRAVLLGSMTSPVIVNSIAKTSDSVNTGSATINTDKNPYAQSVSKTFGNGSTFNKDRLVDNFEVKEHGFIIVMFSLVPHAYYSTGIRRYMMREKSLDYAFPEFANVGDQEVYKAELAVSGITSENWKDVVGYNQRFSEYKYHEDEIHGLLGEGESLNSFALSRGFDTGVTIGTDLIEIPDNFMDSVMVTTTKVSGFNALVDCYFDSKFLRVLPEYSLPSL